MNFEIARSEFNERIEKIQKNMENEGFDLLLAFGNEAEPQFVRYLSDYWPSFETAGVLIPVKGSPILLIGPESMTYAQDRSKIDKIRKLAVFRESSEPEYPGASLDTFNTVIDEVSNGSKIHKIGIVGWSLIPATIFSTFKTAVSKYGEVSIDKADNIIMDLRMIKSEGEIACMKEAARITRVSFDYVLENIKPGMTELNVKGLALAKMFEEGAESEAYPMWVLCGEGSNQAISRSRNKIIEKNEIIHIQIGARVNGYASSIGRPVILGKAASWQRSCIEAGLAGQKAVIGSMKAEKSSGDIAKVYLEEMKRNGYLDWVLYGPCHSTGLMEGEPPWIESNSVWALKENMTFCVDIFLGNSSTQRGLRIEDVVQITREGAEELTRYRSDVIEL